MKMLFLDSEGGHGGSSKSLFLMLKEFSKNKENSINIICKKDSWIKDEYSKLGIQCKIFANMPTYTILDKTSRNIFYFFYFFTYLLPKGFFFF